jgi:hypothetical protein
MANNRFEGLSAMTTRQKVMAVIFVLVIIFIIYQVIGMLRGGSTNSAPASIAAVPQAPIQKPQQANIIPKEAITSAQEQQAMLQQKAAEAQYIASLNQLQSLKVARDIAETNREIIAAKLATITAQKGIVDLLSKPTQPSTPQAYAEGLVNPAAGATSESAQPIQPTQPTYTVISVSQLQGRWGAVLGAQGNLYSVTVGDVLPLDKSVVISIDKSGVLLQKDNVQRKLSLVPII